VLLPWEAVAQSRRKVTTPVTVGRISPKRGNLQLLSQLRANIAAWNMCYPANQLMHQVSEWFVQQPRGIAAAAPEWVRERKRSCRSRPAHAWIWAIPTATSTVLAASTAPVVPMHDCGNGSRQLAFAFFSGSRLRFWRAIGPARPRVVRVAQSRRRQHSRRRPIEQDFRSHEEEKLDVGLDPVPCLVHCGSLDSDDYVTPGACFAGQPKVSVKTAELRPTVARTGGAAPLSSPSAFSRANRAN